TGLPAPLHILVCLLGGAVAGMAYALIPAILKAYFRINEVVVTIMMNNIAIIFTSYLTNGPFADNVGYAATYAVAETAQIARMNSRYRVTYAIYIAVFILFLVWVLMKKTRLGYEISAIGKQKEFADAIGMKVYKKIIIVFLIGGAIAGVAGATEIMGVNIRFTPGWSTNPGLGWDGQAVCLLANKSPFGILITAFLFGAFKYGGVALQSKMGISLDIVNIIKSCLILFLVARYITVNSRIFNLFKTDKSRVAAEEG
ncbi:MAG: ABC transporter permease, partial [Oscillospiraceae bacterium]